MTDRIMMVCEVCGKTDEEVRGWHPRCMKHGGPVCSRCCMACEYSVEFSGLYKCNYNTPEERRAAALKRSQERLAIENAKITDAFIQRRRESARKLAIKNAKARQREDSKRRAKQ